MVSIPFIMAASGLITLSSAAPLTPAPRAVFGQIKPRTDSSYTIFAGDGSMTKGWPSINEWISFDDMWSNNADIVKDACTQFQVDNNSDEETEQLKNAIISVAKEAGLDQRFVAAIVLQESNGCVRAPTTANGVTNPGLMQSHNGEGSCNGPSGVRNPCPEDQIVQMIRDGTLGTAHGDGLKQLIEKADCLDSSKYFKAARMYNSGSIDSSGNLGKGIATHCYSTDIANRVLRWNDGPTECKSAEIGSLEMSLGSFGSAGDIASANDFDSGDSDTDFIPIQHAPASPASSVVAEPAPTPEPTSIDSPVSILPVTSEAPAVTSPPANPTSIPSAPEPTTPIATPSSIPTPPEQDTGETTPSNKYYGATDGCSLYHLVQEDDICLEVAETHSITLEELYDWNRDLSRDCKNLWLGYSYCVRVE